MNDRFPKSRIDNLADGVFAFAMTLLVLDVRVPSGIGLDTGPALAAHLVSLWRQILTYFISFFVLGAMWRACIARRPSREHLSGGVLALWLGFLFFVTMVPFSSSLVARYGEFQPAVYVYSFNMVVLAALVIVIRYLEVPADVRSLRQAAGVHLPLFMVSALLAILISFVTPQHAMFVYFINFLSRLPTRRKVEVER